MTRDQPRTRHDARQLESVATLPSGAAIRLRPIRAEDQPLLIDMAARMTQEDLRFRFFAAMKGLSHELALRLTHIDDAQEMALIAQPSDKDDEIIGVARYAADRGSREAEFAVTVRSDRKGEGIGWVLTEALVAVARARGITKLTGLVLRANTSMLQFCRDYGFAIGVNPADPLSYRASLVLAPSESERTPQDS